MLRQRLGTEQTEVPVEISQIPQSSANGEKIIVYIEGERVVIKQPRRRCDRPLAPIVSPRFDYVSKMQGIFIFDDIIIYCVALRTLFELLLASNEL